MSYKAANADEQLVLDFFDTLSSGDLEKLRTFYHDQSVWEPKVKDIAGAGKHIGMDIIDKFLAPVRGMFEPGDPKVHVHNMFSRAKDSGGAWVCVESNSTGKTGDGKIYDNDYSGCSKSRTARSTRCASTWTAITPPNCSEWIDR